MFDEDKHDYHVQRAREELDRGYRADGTAASQAHLKLAALHMASANQSAATDEDMADEPTA